MAKGKRSTQINARLRQQLAEAAQARRRLEVRMKEVELERDDLADRLALVERHEHPAVAAAELRADSAANKIAIVQAEARSKAAELADLLLSGIAEAKPEGTQIEFLVTPDQIADIRRLGGEQTIFRLFEVCETGLSRTSIRNLRKGPEAIKKHLTKARAVARG